MALLLQYLEISYPATISLTISSFSLQDRVRSLVPVPTSQHSAVHASLPRNLQQAKFVFIRRDAHRTPLQRPYEGPFKVIQPGSKTFHVDIRGKIETTSADRLKPAHMDPEHPAQVAEPRPRRRPPKPPQPPSTVTTQPQTSDTPSPLRPQRTRSGRQVKLPQRYISVLGGVV